MGTQDRDPSAAEGIPAAEVRNAVVSLAALKPHPRNYRRHPEEQLGKLEASLVRFGQVRSIVVQEGAAGRYLLVAGHGLAEAAKRQGLTELRADVIPATWTPEQVEGYLVADNLHGEGADDDMTLLATILEEQRAAGHDLEALGMTSEGLDALLADLANDVLRGAQRDVDDPGGGGDDFDATPDEDGGPTRCQPGDLWQLGVHRLLCGDSTKREDVARLMYGETADILITDPPYGMRLDTDFSGMRNRLAIANGMPKHGNSYPAVIGDDKDFDAAPVATLYDAPEQFWFGADYYASSLGDTQHTGAWLVWDKRLDESADKMFGSCFELIWSRQKHKRGILRHKWAGIFGLSQETEHKRQHPTQKPLTLIADLIERYTEAGALVSDAFLGSGTTLVAAERTGRRCYGMEIDPKFAEVILRRWEAETGREATLLEHGAPSDDEEVA